MKQILILIAFSLTYLMISSPMQASPAEVKRIEKASDEWRQTYKFEKKHYEIMQESLDQVISSDHILALESLNTTTRENIQKIREAALKRLVQLDEKVISLLIREYANNIADMERKYSDLSLEVKKIVHRGTLARQEAIEFALQQIGISAIPSLTRLQTIAVRQKARKLSDRTQKLVKAIINHVKLEQEKLEFQRMADREEVNSPQMPQVDGSMPPPNTGHLTGDNQSPSDVRLE